MSAFIVGDATMDKVVSAILKHYERAGFYAGIALHLSDAGDQIGRKLYQLNADAVAQRYEEPNDCDEAQTYRWQPRGYPRGSGVAVGWYKAVSCLLYQCSEGNVPERDLFKELSAFHDELAHMIASRGTEYNDAPGDSNREDPREKSAPVSIFNL